MARTKAFDKDLVLDKAVELFWKKGLHATSVQDLVSHLGINRASLYDTFGDKESLYVAALERYQAMAHKQMPAFPTQGEEVRSYIHGFLKATVGGCKKDPEHKGCFLANSSADSDGQPEAAQELLKRNMEGFVEKFSGLFGMARESGLVLSDQDDRALARQLFAFVNGLQVLSRLDHDPAHLDAMVEAQLSMMFR